MRLKYPPNLTTATPHMQPGELGAVSHQAALGALATSFHDHVHHVSRSGRAMAILILIATNPSDLADRALSPRQQLPASRWMESSTGPQRSELGSVWSQSCHPVYAALPCGCERLQHPVPPPASNYFECVRISNKPMHRLHPFGYVCRCGPQLVRIPTILRERSHGSAAQSYLAVCHRSALSATRHHSASGTIAITRFRAGFASCGLSNEREITPTCFFPGEC